MRFALFFLSLCCGFQAFSQATDLIISEYVEGSSSNKYIEIYNGTGAAVNLAGYQLRLYANGSGTPTSLTLSGTLNNGATIVYRNSAATVYGGVATNANTVINYNGNDAIALFKITPGVFVDIVGNIGCDPGTAWTATGYSTLDRTLVRNANVCTGVTADPANAPCTFPTLSTEWTAFATDNVANLGSHTMSCVSCVPGAAPTTPAAAFTSTPYCTSAQIGFTAGNGAKHIVVVSTSNFASTPANGTAYTANTTFGSGSTVGAGNYVLLNGTGSSVTITGLSPATNYFVKVFEYNGATPNCDESYLTAGVTSFQFTTLSTCSTPQVRSILVDACSSQEGIDELVIIENGNTPLSISGMTLAFPSGGTYCNSGCGANTFLNNPTYINQLNAQAGCTLFQYADPIPAGAIIVVFCGLTPSYVFDYSSQCPSSSTYYAVFCNNSSTAGRFANSGSGTRTLDATFGANAEQVSYDLGSTLGDGTFVDFDIPGNPTYRQELNCIYPLGVEWSYFTGESVSEGIALSWETLSETDSDHFTVEHADVTGVFQAIGNVPSAGNSKTPLQYGFTDRYPAEGLNYYRLKQWDRNGAFTYSDILAFDFKSTTHGVHYLAAEQQLVFSQSLEEGTQVVLLQANGQVAATIVTDSETTSVPVKLAAGMYVVRTIDAYGKVNTSRFAVY